MNLKQLSEHLGLSQTTVSRALNGYDDVSDKTKARVQAAADRFGYSPNANAQRLATGRSKTIGIVFPQDNNLLLDPLFSEFLTGLAGEAARTKTDVLVKATFEDEATTYRTMARARSADIVVLSSPLVADPRMPLLAGLGLPMIVHGRTQYDHPYAHLDIDNEGAFRRSTELLLDLGHRRVGLLNGRADMTFANDRTRGWRTALANRGLSIPDGYLVHGPMIEEAGYRQTMTMLRLNPAPTAILCGSAFLALGSCRALRDLGLVMGSDVSLIAHDDGVSYLRPEALTPALTTTTSSLRDAGTRIAELAHAIVTGTPPESIAEVWPVDLIFRGSANPPL